MPKPRGSFLGKWAHGRTKIGAQSYEEADREYEQNLVDENDVDGMLHGPSHGGRMSLQKRRILTFVGSLVGILFTTFLLRNTIRNVVLKVQGIPPGLWSRKGQLMIGKETPFFIKGFSWFGMEEERHVLGGLRKTNADRILDFATANDFNAIRIPLAYDSFMLNPEVSTGIDFLANFELMRDDSVNYLDLLSMIIDMAALKNKIIMLDLHRLNSKKNELSGLWYSKEVSEDDVVDFWKRACHRFGGKWNVFGADITNEPYKGLWDSSKSPNNWRRAARRIANVMHDKCPHWLVVVEGVGSLAEPLDDQPFWGENVHVMRSSPLLSSQPKKIAISPHVYGPSVFEQPYFNASDFMTRMPRIWDNHFGNANDFTESALIVGEWGGTYKGRDAAWQNGFSKYLKKKGFGFFYWCLNPESGDTGGLLQSDWVTPESGKLSMLSIFKGTSVEPLKRDFRRRF